MESEIFLTVDSREPWEHPWRKHFPSNVRLIRATLETGDLALNGLDAGAIERKTVGDFLSCVGSERARFERELARSRHLGAFCVIIEGSLADVLQQSRAIHPNVILGSLAAWSRRYCPFMFCGSEKMAADFALRFLAGQVRDGFRIVEAVEKHKAATVADAVLS